MAQKKIILSDKRKEQIKKGFDIANPPKRKNELAYFNKIKAGKARQEKGFKDNQGKFLALPEAFTNKYIKPIAEKRGKTVKEYLKDKNNLRDAKDLFETRAVSWTYNPTTIDKAIKNLKSDFVFIDDGNGRRKFTKEEAKLYIDLQQKNVIEAGGYTLYFKGKFEKEFSQFTIYLEDFEGAETVEDLTDLIAFDDTTIVYSEKKKKKKK